MRVLSLQPIVLALKYPPILNRNGLRPSTVISSNFSTNRGPGIKIEKWPINSGAEFPELKHLAKDPKVEKIRQIDGILPNQLLVYRAPNGTRLVSTYIIIQVLGLSLLGLCGHYVYVHANDLLSSFADIDVDPLPAAFCTCIFSLVVTTATRGILRRSPLRIYLNPVTNEFTLIKLSVLLKRSRINFKPVDVKHMPQSNYFQALFTGSAKIKNCYYYIDPQCFVKPSYYNLLMGRSWETEESHSSTRGKRTDFVATDFRRHRK